MIPTIVSRTSFETFWQQKHPRIKNSKNFCDWVRMHARVFSHSSFWLIPQIWLASYMHILCTWLANEIFWSGQVSRGEGILDAPLGSLCHRLFLQSGAPSQGSWASQLGKPTLKPSRGLYLLMLSRLQISQEGIHLWPLSQIWQGLKPYFLRACRDSPWIQNGPNPETFTGILGGYPTLPCPSQALKIVPTELPDKIIFQ